MSLSSKLTAEALGAFMLSFIGAGAICMATKLGPDGPGLLGIAIAHGLALSIAVSATMNISGGHVNPAVTFAMLFTRRIDFPTAVGYIFAQLAGATVAGFFVYAIFRGMTIPGPSETQIDLVKAAGLGTPTFDPQTFSLGMATLTEALLTFLLVFAVFCTAVDPRAPKIGGFGIGLTICADILLGGPLTGAAMNPSRTFGPGLVAFMTGNLPQFWSQHIVYWAGPIVGAVIAAVVYDGLLAPKKA